MGLVDTPGHLWITRRCELRIRGWEFESLRAHNKSQVRAVPACGRPGKGAVGTFAARTSPDDLCAVRVHAGHRGSGTYLTVLGRGSGIRATVAPARHPSS
jgi:hypothetical protein